MIPFPIKKALFYGYRKGLMKMFGCVFCRIAAGERNAAIVYEDDRCVAFEDTNPQAPVHVLVVPRKHIASLNERIDADEPLLGHLLAIAARVADEKGLSRRGFRIVLNTNAEAGQSVFHLHLHVLGGRIMRWPPG